VQCEPFVAGLQRNDLLGLGRELLGVGGELLGLGRKLPVTVAHHIAQTGVFFEDFAEAGHGPSYPSSGPSTRE